MWQNTEVLNLAVDSGIHLKICYSMAVFKLFSIYVKVALWGGRGGMNQTEPKKKTKRFWRRGQGK